MFDGENSGLSEESKFWRAIGRLEGTVTVLVETRPAPDGGQHEDISARQDTQLALETEYRAELCKLLRRLDQLFYGTLGGGAILMASIVAVRYI